MRLDLVTIVLTVAILWFGGMLGGFVVSYMPWSSGSAWIDGLIIGMVQVALLGLIGLTSGKISLWTLLFGAILIIIGGIAGGFLVDMVGFSDPLGATAIVLIVQTAMLMTFGIVGKGKKSSVASIAKV